ncbi:glutathione S-transferase family protein [Acaryochloris marina]|uniref:Glutathione S-transferase, putative n=1 Tax=Acaryochloris marina (strain MBIC 11017) TaxID=329726 RepID=B0CD01_ACAM1|nr:glutathione S-transferase family protein [Acaryochloris marina]ABW30443.1 glutathione S-transferase, putative [Acaryochloris marina MBIC11017]BDM79257.1 glutathione S-transferase [Acaryochloris marina MBIC10699]
MKLYFMPTTRAVRPRWLLEELNISYKLIRVAMDMSRSKKYGHLHPHGKVPVLIDENVTIFESAAICAYLADKYIDHGFAPQLDAPARAYYYQWLFYASLTLEAPVEQYMFHVLPGLPNKVLPKQARQTVSPEEAKQWFAKVCEPLNEQLTTNDYLVEDYFSAADIVTGGVLLWALKLGMLKQESPVKSYLARLMERPALQKADEDVYAKVD